MVERAQIKQRERERMECNKEEAMRARQIAEGKFLAGDFANARRFALKSQRLFSELDGLPQFMAVLDVHNAAQGKVGETETNWLGILQADGLTDQVTLRKRYKELVRLLHPDRNKSLGAEAAFKLVLQAWRAVSHKLKTVEKTRSLQLSEVRNKICSTQGGYPDISVNPVTGGCPRLDTFVAECPECMTRFEQFKALLNSDVLCINCKKIFVGRECTVCSNDSNGDCKGNVQVRDFGTRDGKTIDDCTKKHNSGDELHGANEMILCSNSLSTKPNMQTCDGPELFRDRDVQIEQEDKTGSQRRHVREITMKSENAAITAESKTGSCSDKPLSRLKDERRLTGMRREALAKLLAEKVSDRSKARRDAVTTESHVKERRYNTRRTLRRQMKPEGADTISRITQRSVSEGALGRPCSVDENVKLTTNAHEFRGVVKASKTRKIFKDTGDGNKNTGIGGTKRCKGGSKAETSTEWRGKGNWDLPQRDTGRNQGVEKSIGSTRNSSCDLLAAASANAEEDTDLMSVPDSEFYEFDKERSEDRFQQGQIWAVYDDTDGMPRFYARIIKVISNIPFRIQIAWLDANNSGDEIVAWLAAGNSLACGEFKTGEPIFTSSHVDIFSHLMRWEEGENGEVKIYPGKDEVWALYKGWNPCLKRQEIKQHEYELVMAVTHYTLELGVGVVHLGKIQGYRTVFQQEKGVVWIRKGELTRFSHQVPVHCLGVDERVPVSGCMELDPASIPIHLVGD